KDWKRYNKSKFHTIKVINNIKQMHPDRDIEQCGKNNIYH
ncbi:hypothetical protein EC990672_1412B, partial [Escherichia coli 99.0672]